MEDLRQKLKLFNYRPLVLVFLGLIFGVLVANFILRETLITIVGIVILVGVTLFYSILHKRFMYFIILSVAFVVGFTSFSLYIDARKHKYTAMEDMQAVGVIASIKNYDSCLNLLLENVKVDGKELDYNVTLYYYNIYQGGYIKVDIGSKITFNIESNDTINYYDEEGLPHTYNIKNNIGAKMTTYEVEILDQSSNIRTSFLDKIKSNLKVGLNNLNSKMIYSAMFGDKTELNDDLYASYKTSGVAHLLAVSGLHVGLVVAIIYWILKKLHIKSWWRVAIVSALLLGYAYLCGFSYSIIRASIMSLVLMIAPLLFSEYDLLSSICFAGSLILIIEPIALFDVGALLSFGCVLGIAMLYPVFTRWLSKIPLKQGIKNSFSISLATVITTSIIMSRYFGYIQPIGLISNIVIIPIFSILFTFSFVVAMVSTILPFISYLLILINPLFEALNWVIIFIANHSVTWLTPNVNFISVLLFFILIACASKFNLKKGTTKLTMIGVCSCILALQVALI